MSSLFQVCTDSKYEENELEKMEFAEIEFAETDKE